MRYVYYVSVRIIYGMCITTVRKNLHPHKKVGLLSLGWGAFVGVLP